MHRIGIYSGTFDPVHPGHIAFAREALLGCNLERVVFLPEHSPRGKQKVTSLDHRVALLQHEIADIPALQIQLLDSDQFTVKNTLPELKKLFPDTELTLLVGSDIVQTFLYRWDGLSELLREMPLAIGIRERNSVQEVATTLDKLEHDLSVPIRYTIVHTQEPAAASSQFRNGSASTGQLHPQSQRYIQENKLYE